MGPSLQHALGATAFMAAAFGLWALGVRSPEWWGAIVNATYFASRELAQFLRGTGGGKPLSEIDGSHIRQAGWPTLAGFVLAAAIHWGNEWLGAAIVRWVL